MLQHDVQLADTTDYCSGKKNQKKQLRSIKYQLRRRENYNQEAFFCGTQRDERKRKEFLPGA